MEPGDSLIMGDENLSTIPEKESDEFINSSVEDLVTIPSESEDTSDNDNFTSSDNESLSNEDVPEDKNIESKDSYVSNLDEPTLLVTPISYANEDECFNPGGENDEIDAFLEMDISIDIENGYHDSEGDIIYNESLLINDSIPNLPPEASKLLFSNTEPNSNESKVNSIMTRSGLTTTEPSIPPLVPPTPRVGVEKELETLIDEVHITSPASTAHVPPPGFQPMSPPKPKEDPKPNHHQPKIPYPSRIRQNFLIKMMFKCLNLEVYNSLADSGASINLMPLSIFEKLGIRPLKPTQMTLELANRSVTFPMRIAEEVIIKVKKFNFLVDFVIVDFEADPKVPIILGRLFLRTARALVDLYEEKLTLRVGNEEVVFYTNKSLRNNSRDIQSVHCINIINFSKDKMMSGNPTPSSDSMIESPSSFPTPCGDNDHLLEETDTLLSHFDNSPPEYDNLLALKLKKRVVCGNTILILIILFRIMKLSILMTIILKRRVVAEADSGEFTRVLNENIFDLSTKDFTSIELNKSPLLLYDCDSFLSEEFSEIDILVSFPSGNEDIVFDPRIIIIKGVQS
ncbi:reverse transcriptase domain-containing protein [Tanacetum coccineum]